MTDKSLFNINIWIHAARPRTLLAAFIPVTVGSALAYSHGYFTVMPSLVALLCAVLLQIGSNYSNDLFDFLAGADTKDRKGPSRVIASGLVTPKQMRSAIILVFGLAFIIGLYLIKIGGLLILLIGIASIIAAITYTGGPYPLGYKGWGDVMVFLFFGLIGTVGTYYLHSLELSIEAFFLAIPVGALITNILIVNNYRDVETDRKVKKMTTAVIFGRNFARKAYFSLLLTAFLVPIIIWIMEFSNNWILLPLILLPFGVYLVRMLRTLKGSELNFLLERTVQFAAVYGFLLAVGIIL